MRGGTSLSVNAVKPKDRRKPREADLQDKAGVQARAAMKKAPTRKLYEKTMIKNLLANPEDDGQGSSKTRQMVRLTHLRAEKSIGFES